jgi:hypothetical protein
MKRAALHHEVDELLERGLSSAGPAPTSRCSSRRAAIAKPKRYSIPCVSANGIALEVEEEVALVRLRQCGQALAGRDRAQQLVHVAPFAPARELDARLVAGRAPVLRRDAVDARQCSRIERAERLQRRDAAVVSARAAQRDAGHERQVIDALPVLATACAHAQIRSARRAPAAAARRRACRCRGSDVARNGSTPRTRRRGTTHAAAPARPARCARAPAVPCTCSSRSA